MFYSMYNRWQKSQQQCEYLLSTIYSSNYSRNFITSLYFLKEESKRKHTEDGALSYATRDGVQNNSMIIVVVKSTLKFSKIRTHKFFKLLKLCKNICSLFHKRYKIHLGALTVAFLQLTLVPRSNLLALKW